MTACAMYFESLSFQSIPHRRLFEIESYIAKVLYMVSKRTLPRSLSWTQ